MEEGEKHFWRRPQQMQRPGASLRSCNIRVMGMEWGGSHERELGDSYLGACGPQSGC